MGIDLHHPAGRGKQFGLVVDSAKGVDKGRDTCIGRPYNPDPIFYSAKRGHRQMLIGGR